MKSVYLIRFIAIPVIAISLLSSCRESEGFFSAGDTPTMANMGGALPGTSSAAPTPTPVPQNNGGGMQGSDGGTIAPPGGGTGGDSGTISTFTTDTFLQDQFTERYDFLWVVDNSGSMSNIRAFMQQNLTNFVNVLESRRQLDWQMAVTITDNEIYRGDLIASSGGVRVVSRNTPNVASVWSSIIARIPSTAKSGWEQGLESSRSAIENYGAEFTRPNTPVIVTYITDEEDYSCAGNCNNFSYAPESFNTWVPHTVSSYTNYFQGIANELGAQVILYPIVHLLPLGGSNPCTDDYGSAGNRYMAVQEGVGTGKSLSICEQNLAASFDQVAQLTANLGVCFTLNNTPATLNGMVVMVNGSIISASASNGYHYEAAANQVCFSGNAIPDNGAEVKVKYRR